MCSLLNDSDGMLLPSIFYHLITHHFPIGCVYTIGVTKKLSVTTDFYTGEWRCLPGAKMFIKKQLLLQTRFEIKISVMQLYQYSSQGMLLLS